MASEKPNRILVLLNTPFADWEVGFLTAAAQDFFDVKVEYYGPGGGDVVSEGGLHVRTTGPFAEIDPSAAKALVVCGSQAWAKPDAANISPLLNAAIEAKTTIGVICAGTLTAARAGLFDTRKHTSNGHDWLKENARGYDGSDLYQDVNDAVADGGVISAPASAPAAFARAVLSDAFPGHPALAPTLKILSAAR